MNLQNPAPCIFNISASTDDEQANVAKVKQTMDIVLRTPIVKEAVIMPDACPAGPMGVIPVGGVVATEAAIMPGMHSADICCSLMMTVFYDVDPPVLLDAVYKSTHFGPGGRQRGQQFSLSEPLKKSMQDNYYLSSMSSIAQEHMGTQGDGNHFAYVGTLASTGQTVLVTHHGSRAVGARLYTRGMKLAEKICQKLSPETYKANAWIPLDSREGKDYWEALQIVREWTKHNHASIHNRATECVSGKIFHRRWNEHNFVFREETVGIDARFWCGEHDLSELPSAYKDAESVQADMKAFELADVCDRVMPYGSIMAGNWQHNAPWRKKRRR